VILGLNVQEAAHLAGLKQALGDPGLKRQKIWTVGSVIEGPIVSITKFGALYRLLKAWKE